MNIRRFERRKARIGLPEALLTLAASLPDATDADDALDRLTSGLAERDIDCAVFAQEGERAGLRLERATLPFVSEIWGRTLLLPRIAPALTFQRPVVYSDPGDAFSEAPANGARQPLLASRVVGTLIAAPLRIAQDRAGVLCLASRELKERDSTAVWALALQLGVALRQAGTDVRPAQSAEGQPAQVGASDLSLFHELTRRLSYSLSSEEAVQAALGVLAPTLGLQLAVSVVCHSGEDITTVYAQQGVSDRLAKSVASDVFKAFLRLTGEKHRSCHRAAFTSATLTADAPAEAPKSAGTASGSTLDAPLVIEGEVIGLLRVSSAGANAFAEADERTFFTVANQVSLALERVAAQRAAERAHLASLAESLSDGIVLVDATLQVTSLNSAAHGHLEAIVGADLTAGDTLTETPLAQLAQEALASGRATAQQEFPSSPNSAERRYRVAMAAPLAGSPEGSAAVVILRDVTEERLMQERLLQSEKMVSVGQLVSGVAHEINNPLTGIMGFAQLLLARELDERTLRDVETIHTEAERAAKIVQNLLSFARRKRADKEPANLNALMERVLELRNYDLMLKNIEVELDLDPKLPETMVDADQIQQVFLNVIINGEQAMLDANGRGTLTVRTRLEGDMIQVSLRDDGPGITPETLRRIFDPFFTTKETGEGTGLGLTISYGIIDEHGGRIRADSQPGRGTTFTIELPIIRGGGRTPVAVEEGASATTTGRSILVVDDEESIQRLLGSILQLDGHQVDTARNGIEALERIGRKQYDVVITDIKMPDMDGPGLYEQLRKLDRSLAQRTVFITGDTVSPETRDFLERVRNPCLAKPFRIRQVRETILQLLADGT